MKKQYFIFGSIVLVVLIIGFIFLGINLSVKEQTINQELIKNRENVSGNNFSDINVFWVEFRKAILGSDFNKIDEFTVFPVGTRGPLVEPFMRVFTFKNEEKYI